MAPDFEYLLRLEPYALLSHSSRGLVIFCLPAGLLAAFLWDGLLRPFARDLLTLAPDPSEPPILANWWWVVLAVLAGSATHVGWDAFTHRDAVGPALVPALRETALVIRGYVVPWYNLLQIGSSVLGGGVVFGWLWRLVSREGRGAGALVAGWRLRAWTSLGATALAVGVWNAPRRGIMSDITQFKLVLGRAAVGGLVGLAIGFVALALLHRAGRFPGNVKGVRHA